MRDRSFARELPALKAKPSRPVLLSCSWGLANRLRSIAHYAAARSSHVVDPSTYRFLGRPISYRSHTLRSTSAADAVLEAYVLAHCKKIWGTYGSSFSALASRWLPRPRGSFELMRVQEAG